MYKGQTCIGIGCLSYLFRRNQVLQQWSIPYRCDMPRAKPDSFVSGVQTLTDFF